MTNTNTTLNNEFSTLVESAIAFAMSTAILRDAKSTAELARETMVPILRAHAKDSWKTLNKGIKDALTAQKMSTAQVTAWLGVFKTCFEYKILPTDSNSDRLRKADSWINWSGSKVPNTYGKVHAPKPEAVKAETAAPVVTNVPPQAAPAAKAKAPVVTPAKVDDAMSPFEVWGMHFDKFMDHGVNVYYMKKLAGLLNMESDALNKAMRQAKADLEVDAKRALQK